MQSPAPAAKHSTVAPTRHCTGGHCATQTPPTRRTVSYKASGPDASGMYDASYSVVQGVGARRVGDVRRVGRCRGPTRRKIPISTVVAPGGTAPPRPHPQTRCVLSPCV